MPGVTKCACGATLLAPQSVKRRECERCYIDRTGHATRHRWPRKPKGKKDV